MRLSTAVQDIEFSDMLQEVVGNLEEGEELKLTAQQWQEEVLSHMEPKELSDGKPKAIGLRRVFQEVYGGEIIGDIPEIVDTPSEFNSRRYVVQRTMQFRCVSIFNDDIVRTFAEVAEAGEPHLPQPFSNHPAASAATKAEGRLLRKIMGLSICAAEEVDNFVQPKETPVDTVDEGEIELIKLVCRKIGLSEAAVLSNVSVFLNHDVQVKAWGDLDYSDFKVVKRALQNMQRKEEDQWPEKVLANIDVLRGE